MNPHAARATHRCKYINGTAQVLWKYQQPTSRILAAPRHRSVLPQHLCIRWWHFSQCRHSRILLSRRAHRRLNYLKIRRACCPSLFIDIVCFVVEFYNVVAARGVWHCFKGDKSCDYSTCEDKLYWWNIPVNKNIIKSVVPFSIANNLALILIQSNDIPGMDRVASRRLYWRDNSIHDFYIYLYHPEHQRRLFEHGCQIYCWLPSREAWNNARNKILYHEFINLTILNLMI